MSRRPANPPNHTHVPPHPAHVPQGGGPASMHYQPQTQKYYHPPPPGYVSGPVHHALPDPTEILAQRISQILASHQAHTDTRLNRIETNIQRLSSEMASARSESRGHVTQIAEVLQKSHELHVIRLKRLENILGMGPDMKDQKTLLERFDLLSFAVDEFLERVRDPEANLPEGPLHHDMATSPFKRPYADAGTLPKTPSPKPHSASVAVGSSSPSPCDDFSARNNSSLTIVANDESINRESSQVDKQNANGDFFGDIMSRPIPKTTFASASPVTRPLVPADWHDHSPSPQQSLAFDPDRSSEGMEAYSALPNQPPAEDGSIASLRQATLGDRFGPSTSMPGRSTSVHPVSPASPVSPSQSPHQITTFPTHNLFPPNDNGDHPSPAPDHSPAPEEPPPAEDLSTRDSSVGVHPLPPAESERTTPSRSPTVEPEDNVELESPTTDTLREELSVLNMMKSPQSDVHSNPASPSLLRGEAVESQPLVPSSITPSPMLPPQMKKSSPPRLMLSIPDRGPTSVVTRRSSAQPHSPSTSPRQGSTYPGAADLFDPFMSPLSPSPSTPSQAPESRSPSPSPAPKNEPMLDIPAPQSSPNRPTTSVLRLKLGGPSPEASQPKKRKAHAGEDNYEPAPESVEITRVGPPSKRARKRIDMGQDSAIGASESGSGNAGKGKKKKKVKEEGDPIVWPAMTPQEEVDPEFVGKFVGCDRDKCERWYHYSCLGIVPDVSRLKNTFHCPFCVAGHPPPKRSTIDDGANEQCSRPGCPIQDEFFEPAGIFGRYTKLHSTRGRVLLWLVFWKGYEWKDATWEPNPPSVEAKKVFERRATKEGFDLDDETFILLSEASKGGVKNPDA